MVNDNKNNTQTNCILELLTVINNLQHNASCCDEINLDTCDHGFLTCPTSFSCNTRPVMLYTATGNGTPWSMSIVKENIICNDINAACSAVFRIEKIDKNCATFRVLVANPDTTATTIPFVATNTFFTMDLTCCCALRCLPDTFVEGI